MTRNDRRSRWARLALATAAVLMALTPASASAAGEYAQEFCNTGSGDSTRNAWYLVGAPAVFRTCDPSGAYPHNGVYGNAATLAEGKHHGLRAQAPSGAVYRRLTTDLRVPFQSCNRRTYIEDGAGYTFSNHNCWGGQQSFNTAGSSFTVDLRDSRYFVIGQACSGSPGTCEAGDWYLSYARATLYDSTPPRIEPHKTGIFDTGRTAFRGWVDVTADVYDSGKGPQAAEVFVDNNRHAATYWPDGTCDFRLSNPCADRLGWVGAVDTTVVSDGPHTVRVQADDGLGNVASVDRTVIFDNTPPSMGAAPALDGQTATAATARLSFSATDATTGVQSLERSVDGAAWETAAEGATADVLVAGLGQHSVRVRAIDRAGNVSAEQAVTFTLQAPPANHRLTTLDGVALPGAPGPGDTVRCDVGGPWTEGTTFAFSWLRGGEVVKGATDQTYTLVAGDVTQAIACRISATNAAGTTVLETSTVQSGMTGDFGRRDSGSDTTGADGASTQAGPPTNGTNASDRAVASVTGQRIRTVRYGRRIATVGRLHDENGRPIQRASVTITERTYIPQAGLSATAAWVPVGTVTTDDRGAFRFLIPARHSRTLRFGYKARLADRDFTSTSELTLLVYSKARLKVSRKALVNGQTVRFDGRVVSGPLPSTGVVVDLQAHRPGRGWVTFKVTRAKRRNGRFGAAYRFTATSGTQTYRFRARIRQDSSYPYLLSRTRQVKVKVRG